jgi:hypothetical protein
MFDYLDVIGQLRRKVLAHPAFFFVLKRYLVPMAFVAHRLCGLIMNLERKSFLKALSVMNFCTGQKSSLKMHKRPPRLYPYQAL